MEDLKYSATLSALKGTLLFTDLIDLGLVR